MERIIKFRAWCELQKTMYEPFTLLRAIHEEDVRIHDEHDIFMQFTGLLDKNEREIYEGDILRTWEDETEVTTGEQKMVVDDAFNCYLAIRDMIIKKDVESLGVYIIGNIYENPELV